MKVNISKLISIGDIIYSPMFGNVEVNNITDKEIEIKLSNGELIYFTMNGTLRSIDRDNSINDISTCLFPDKGYYLSWGLCPHIAWYYYLIVDKKIGVNVIVNSCGNEIAVQLKGTSIDMKTRMVFLLCTDSNGNDITINASNLVSWNIN